MPDWTALRKKLLGDRGESVLPPQVRLLKLPMLPRALSEFTQRAQDPDADAAELSRIISTDAGLTSELLRYVNSCAVGARSTVTSVQQALAMHGIRSTQLYLTTTGLKNAMRATASKLIHFESFWNTNLERALLARAIAKLLRADADVAFTAAMLQDFLLPLVANPLYDDYVEYAENRDSYANLTDFEQQRFGWDHGEAGAQVMLGWNMPDELVCCIAMHHRGVALLDDPDFRKSSVAAVAVAAMLPDALRQETEGIETLIKLEWTWSKFELIPLAKQIDEEFQAVATNANNHFSFLRVCEKALRSKA